MNTAGETSDDLITPVEVEAPRSDEPAPADAFLAKDWLASWQALGAEIERSSVDPRSLREILDQDRR